MPVLKTLCNELQPDIGYWRAVCSATKTANGPMAQKWQGTVEDGEDSFIQLGS